MPPESPESLPPALTPGVIDLTQPGLQDHPPNGMKRIKRARASRGQARPEPGAGPVPGWIDTRTGQVITAGSLTIGFRLIADGI